MASSPADSTPPPPPTGRDWTLRLIGILLAFSTPISGIIPYALVAILLGEDRLETGDGLTTLGMVVFATPLLLGAALVLWSFLTPRTPDRRMTAILVAIASAIMFGVGLSSTLTARGDASIGGGILVLSSIALGALAVGLFHR